jgi:signal transduction histidine kinase
MSTLDIKVKIVLIVSLQIFLIVSSFLTLVYIENEWLVLGNSINHAGLNRFLSANVMLDLHNLHSHYTGNDSMSSLNALKDNMELLKNGGYADAVKIKPLPDDLLPYWETTYSDLIAFEKNIDLYNSPGKNTAEGHAEIDLNYENLLKSSDILTSEISMFLQKIDTLLINLQVTLLLINSLVHVLLLKFILRILKKESDEKTKLEKFAIIGKLGASISHDLRNPLTVIKGSVELLKLKKDAPLSELEEKQFTKISKSIDDISYLISDLLNFTKISDQHLQETGLLEIIQSSMDEIKIPENVKIKIPENDSKVKVDKIRIQTVISNLIKNSIDSIDGEGIISIQFTDGFDDVLLTLTDTGSGISSKDLPHIFEPLFTTKIHGTGLGLSNCKRIIEQHRGTIEVLNNPTRFLIRLPKK